MAEIEIFTHPQLGEVRTMLDNQGQPWFVGKDVAVALGYTNCPKAIRDHVVDDDKTVNESFTVNGTTPVLINESGLYSLILSSKLPQAREFKHWVTAEVLPQIRKTGGYIPVQQDDDEEAILSKALLIAQRTMAQQRQQLLEQQPAVDFANAITAGDDSILVRELAKLITQNGVQMGERRLYRWLREHGYLFQQSTSPIQRYVEQGLFVTSVTLISTHHGSEERITTKVTGKGQQYFIDGFLSGRFAL